MEKTIAIFFKINNFNFLYKIKLKNITICILSIIYGDF